MSVVGRNSTRTKCTFTGCSELFYHKSKIVNHLNIYHQVNAQKRSAKFSKRKKFMEWKKKEKLRNYVYYLKQCDGDSEMIFQKYFLCQHTDSAHNHPVNLGNTIYQPIPSATQQEIKAKVSI